MFRKVGSQMIKPYTHLFKSAKDLVDVGFETVKTFKEVRNTIKDGPKGPDLDAMDAKERAVYEREREVKEKARSIASDRERFDFMYRTYGWTEPELESRKTNVARNQALYQLLTFIGIAVFVWAGSMISGFMTFAAAGLCMLCVFVMAGQSMRFAHMLYQLDQRALCSFQSFSGSDDLYKALTIRPWKSVL